MKTKFPGPPRSLAAAHRSAQHVPELARVPKREDHQERPPDKRDTTLWVALNAVTREPEARPTFVDSPFLMTGGLVGWAGLVAPHFWRKRLHRASPTRSILHSSIPHPHQPAWRNGEGRNWAWGMAPIRWRCRGVTGGSQRHCEDRAQLVGRQRHGIRLQAAGLLGAGDDLVEVALTDAE